MQICHRDITITDTLATANTFTLDYMYSVQQVRVQLPTSADNVTLFAFAAEPCACAILLQHPTATAIDRHLLPTGPTAANPSHWHAVVHRWDRQTERRCTVTQTPLHTMQAVSINCYHHVCFQDSFSSEYALAHSTSSTCSERKPPLVGLRKQAEASKYFKTQKLTNSTDPSKNYPLANLPQPFYQPPDS